eukprot:m51a1_g7032 putative heat shock protein hsp70 family protein (555) ;mRNA; r:77684-79709
MGTTTTLATIVALAALAAAAAAWEEEPIRCPAVGIDLGTALSRVGYLDGDRGVVVIPNERGSRATPSVVAFTEAGVLVGEQAVEQQARNPLNTVFGLKRLIGRTWRDPEVQRDVKLLPFRVVGRENRPLVVVEHAGRRRLYSPEEISALVVAKLRRDAEAFLGHEVTHAVVACPAHFTSSQRWQTDRAVLLAGLRVLRTPSEPAVAIVAFERARHTSGEAAASPERSVVVCDLGSSVYDVTLLQVANDEGVYEIRASAGDSRLGGDDFDQRIADHALGAFMLATGKDASRDRLAVQRLRVEAERAKRALSVRAQHTIEMADFFEGADLRVPLSRALFEELCADLVERLVGPVRQVLENERLRRDQVDEVVLVGGSAAIPRVRQLFRDFFGREPSEGVDPGEAVVYGAAVVAGLAGQPCDSHGGTPLPLTLGIETADGAMMALIPRGTAVPAKRSRLFSARTDSLGQVSIRVFEGERAVAKDNRLLGRLDLEGVAPGPGGPPEIEVTLEVDDKGIATISARDTGSGQSKSVAIETERGRPKCGELHCMSSLRHGT